MRLDIYRLRYVFSSVTLISTGKINVGVRTPVDNYIELAPTNVSHRNQLIN